MRTKIFFGTIMVLICLSSTGQNHWKDIKEIFRKENKEECFFLDSSKADSVIKYIKLSELDSCKVIDSLDYVGYDCTFNDFSLAYIYKTKRYRAYMVFSGNYQAWMRKEYGLKLLDVLKQKCSK